MIVPKGKKGLSCSQTQLKLLLPRDMIVSWGKANFPPGKAQVPQGNKCLFWYKGTRLSFGFGV